MNNSGNIIISDDIYSFSINKRLIFKFEANIIIFIININFNSVVTLFVTKSDILSMSLIDLILNDNFMNRFIKKIFK